MIQRRRATARVLIFAAAAALLTLSLAGPALGQQVARLKISNLTAAPGASGVIDAELTCNPQCGAVALSFTYDPAILQIDRVVLGGALGDPTAGQVAALENGIDQRSGRLDLALLAAVPVPQAVDDRLFSLEVTVLAVGETVLTPERAEFSNLRGADIPGEVLDGIVRGQEGAAASTPTPGLVLVAATPSGTAEGLPDLPTGEACTISTVVQGVPIHVGPSRDRAIRSSLPTNTEVSVTGQFTNSVGELWWRIQPAGVTTELDRYWVLETDVDETGDCTYVPQTEGSAVVAAGAGFAHSFAPGERQFSHILTLPGGDSVLTCSGTPVYPEFQVGNQRSNGQTSLNLSGAGAQTLIVFSTVINNRGQVTPIVSYSCTLARR